MKPSRGNLFFYSTLIFVYFLLFEFILPVNQILPKPTILAETLISIWSDYNLLIAIAITSTTIYIALFIGYILMFFFTKYFLYFFSLFQDFYKSLSFYKYVPSIFTIIIFIYWFDNSIIARTIYGILLVIFLLKMKTFEELSKIKDEYYIAAKSLILTDKEIYSKVIFKTIQPSLAEEIFKTHFVLWSIILIYEFIVKSGLGGIYSEILLYNDFTSLYAITLIISLLIWFGNFMLKIIKIKYIFWES